LEIVADAITRAGTSDDREKLRSALAATTLDTVVGRFSFLPSREPDHPSVVQVVRHGRLTILK
jgi:ABC-type branched-subunit amino acid transport system substrate-binding protein